jgi:hypothetical protein
MFILLIYFKDIFYKMIQYFIAILLNLNFLGCMIFNNGLVKDYKDSKLIVKDGK